MTDPSPQPSSRRRSATVPVVVAVVAALVAAFAVFSSQSSDGSPGASDTATSRSSNAPQPSSREASPRSTADGGSGQANPLDSLARRKPDDPMAKGRLDAPVVMINYSDFQCPFCGKFARDTEPALQKYVDDGTLRIEWRDFPYLGEESGTAAIAARAASRQDGFWKLHDALYQDQTAPNSGTLTKAHLITLAESVGLDGDRLKKDMKDPRITSQIRADFMQGQSIGVTGTPAFIINGKPIIGAQPTKVFIKAIEQAAADAR